MNRLAHAAAAASQLRQRAEAQALAWAQLPLILNSAVKKGREGGGELCWRKREAAASSLAVDVLGDEQVENEPRRSSIDANVASAEMSRLQRELLAMHEQKMNKVKNSLKTD